jgi:hypothetical protein
MALMGDECLESKGPRQPNRSYPHPFLREWTYTPTREMSRRFREEVRDIQDDVQRRRMFDEYYKKNPSLPLELDDELLTLLCKFVGKEVPERKRHPMDRPVDYYDFYSAFLKAAGLDKRAWGMCPVCKGSGMDPAHEKAYEEWEETPPPEGPGYQLWENVSEGSPVSPVFPTEEAFIAYLTGVLGHSEQAARNFCKSGYAFSMTLSGDGVMRHGIETCANMTPPETPPQEV